MLPSEYKARYENIQVSLDNGSTLPVKVNRYRLASANYNAAANKAFYDKLKKNGIDTTLSVDTILGPSELNPSDFNHIDFIAADDDGKRLKLGASNISAWAAMAHYCFLGKGAPEHCQIVLQLAAHWKLATPPVATDLQDYADKALGLDCNGFVGNYLWHVKKNRPWRDLGLGNLDLGPDALISGYFDNQPLVANWEALDPAQSYIMALVNESGDIIPGGPRSPGPGHIAITDPHTRAERVQQDRSKSFAVWTVESTAAITPGLSASWYSFLGMTSANVFFINREGMEKAKHLSFKIAQVR